MYITNNMNNMNRVMVMVINTICMHGTRYKPTTNNK